MPSWIVSTPFPRLVHQATGRRRDLQSKPFRATWKALPDPERRMIAGAVSRGRRVENETLSPLAAEVARRWRSHIRWVPLVSLVSSTLVWSVAYWSQSVSFRSAVLHILQEPAFWIIWFVAGFCLPVFLLLLYRRAEQANS